MQSKKIQIGLVEQLSLSGGNCIFFVICAKFLGIVEFANFSIIWVGSQILLSISIPWITLPITSISIEVSNKTLIKNILRKIVKLILIAPILLFIYSALIPQQIAGIEILVMYLLGVAVVLHDSLRFLMVRKDLIKASLIINLIGVIISILSLFLLSFLYSEKHGMYAVVSLLSGKICIVFISFYICRSKIPLRTEETTPSMDFDNPLLHLGISNLFNSIALNLAFAKLNILVFGAIQAFRTILNFIPFLLQFMESHFSADLVKNKKNTFLGTKFTVFYFICVLLISAILFLFSRQIIILIYGNEFVQFKFEFICLFLLIAIQSFSRLLNIENRLQKNNKVFHLSSIFLWCSSVLYLLSLRFNSLSSSNVIISSMLMTAFLQFSVYFYSSKIKLNQ